MVDAVCGHYGSLIWEVYETYTVSTADTYIKGSREEKDRQIRTHPWERKILNKSLYKNTKLMLFYAVLSFTKDLGN